MRRRRASSRLSSMARRPGGSRWPDLVARFPRARLVAGWAVAIGFVVLVAFVVGRLGGEAGGPAVASPSASGEPTPAPIAFGTALSPDGTAIAGGSETDRFAPGDRFAYAFAPARAPATDELYVEVVRIGGGPQQAVQTPAPQAVTPGARQVGYQVPADALFSAFGRGDYVMRVYLDPAAPPVAEGRFKLVEPIPSG